MGKLEREKEWRIENDRWRKRGREIQGERQSYIKVEIVQMRDTVTAKDID